MEILFSVLGNLVYGLFGLLLLLFLLALLFGRRIRKRWEFEAEFRDRYEREFGEFDMELSRVGKQESGYSFKARFRMRHESLERGQAIEIYLDDTLVMRGTVTRPGRVFLRDKAVMNAVTDPREGQVCRVVWGGIERFRAPILRD